MRDAAGRAEYHYVLVDYVCKVVRGRPRAGDDVSRVEWVRRGAARGLSSDRRAPRSDRQSIACTPKTFSNLNRCGSAAAATCAARWASGAGRDRAEVRIAAAIEAALADAAEAIEYLRPPSQPQPASRGAAIRIRFERNRRSGERRSRGCASKARRWKPTEIFEVGASAGSGFGSASDFAGRARTVSAAGGNTPNAIADLRDLANDLRGKILPDGSVADDASVALGGCAAKSSGSGG